MLKTYKYKLNPSKEQEILLNKHFGCVRFVYNYFLNERKKEYETNKQTLNYYDNANALTQLKKKEETFWLKEVNAQSLQYSLKCLDGAYVNFFKERTKFPQFKSKKDKNSFTVPQYTKIEKNKLIIRKFKEGINIILHKPLIGVIKNCTITKTSTNKFFVSILVETEHIKLSKTNKSIGIDLGLKDFVITSDGYKYKNNKYTKTYEKKLKIAQQHLSRKKKDSNRYKQQRLKAAKIHEKITNSRIDNLHKISHDLITKYDIIYLEDLNIKGMVKNHKLAKHISDASWGNFVNMLIYKAEWNNKEIIKINRFYPSSKACNICGYINQDLKLDIRSWICPICNTNHDRDINAAKNIYKEGLKISSGTDDHRRGDEIRPVTTGIINETSKILNLS